MFSRTPTVSWASAQINSDRLCISKRRVLVKRESKASSRMCRSAKSGSEVAAEDALDISGRHLISSTELVPCTESSNMRFLLPGISMLKLGRLAVVTLWLEPLIERRE